MKLFAAASFKLDLKAVEIDRDIFSFLCKTEMVGKISLNYVPTTYRVSHNRNAIDKYL